MYTRSRILRAIVVATAITSAGAAPAWAQTEGVIHGRVVAAATGAAVSSATVTLASTGGRASLQAATNGAGEFTFLGVVPGEHLLTAGAPGFRSKELGLALEPREVRRVVVSLEVAAVTASVNVTETSVPGTHSPSSTVLTAERLESLPPSSRTNLPDALVTLAPGMIRGHDDFVHVRGHEVALNPLINGVSFWENPHSVFSGGLSPDVIEAANVMTGGFPAEYGNRFGGVVDIVTKSGLRLRERGSVAMSAGGAGRHGVTTEAGAHRGRIGVYGVASAFTSDRFLSPPDPTAIHDTARGGHAFLQIDGTTGDTSALRAVVIADGANFEIPTTPLDLELRPLAAATERTRQQTAMVNWTRIWSGTVVSTSAYQRWSRSRLLPAAGPLTARADLERGVFTVGVKADVTRVAGGHTFKAGLDAVRLGLREDLAYDYAGFRELTHLLALPHIHITGNAIAFAGRETGGQVSVYAQDTMTVSRRITANLGVRIDHHRLAVSATHLSPRVNVAIHAGGDTVLHASYNRFFVPPPVEGLLSTNAGLTRFIQEIGVALPALQPTVEDQVEAGVSTRLRPIQLGVTGYVRASDHPVHTTVWPDSRVYSYASFDRARAYGLEVKASLPTLARYGLTGSLNYALGRVYFFGPVTGGFVTEAAHLTDTSRFLAPMDQTHTLTAAVTYRHAGSGFWIGTAADYGSGTPMGHGGAGHDHGDEPADHEDPAASGDTGRVPGHATADLSFGMDLVRDANRRSRLSLTVTIENLANRVYLIATEGEFSPRQYSLPRLASVTAKVRF